MYLLQQQSQDFEDEGKITFGWRDFPTEALSSLSHYIQQSSLSKAVLRERIAFDGEFMAVKTRTTVAVDRYSATSDGRDRFIYGCAT